MALVKELFKPGSLVTAPGIFDGISARMADPFGFDLLYMTGYGTVASYLGVPDAGIASYADMVGRVQMIANVIKTPFIADGDTGYGGLLNMHHTVKGYEAAGAAGIQIEDQEFPKKCGHFANKAIVPTVEMVNKIKAAVDARLDPEMKIIARTDARGISGINEALDRAAAFVEAGADATFVEAPKNLAELKAIPSRIHAPQVANMVFGGLTPEPGREALAAMGYSIILYANAALQTAIHAVDITLSSLRDTGSLAECSDLLASFDKRQAVVQKEKWDEFERKHN